MLGSFKNKTHKSGILFLLPLGYLDFKCIHTYDDILTCGKNHGQVEGCLKFLYIEIESGKPAMPAMKQKRILNRILAHICY